jgi:sugar (pentulose or hexulose) kinase
MSTLGLDIGTSATKGILLDDHGRVLAEDRRGYRVREPAPGRAELPAARVWVAARGVLVSLAGVGERAGSPVRAVCAGGSGDDIVMVDPRGRPVAPVIMAADGRSSPEGRALAGAMGAEAAYLRTGLWDLGTTPAARWRWLERHRPAEAARVTRLLSWPEWLMTRLGLPAMVDPTLAARTLAYDRATHAYASATDALGLPVGLLSPIVPTGTNVGVIPARRADALGLRRGTSYVVGGFDQAMATLGAGAIEPGVGHDGNGTWEAFSLRIPGRTVDPGLRASRWSMGPAASGPQAEVMTSWMGGRAWRRARHGADDGPAGLADRLADAVRGLAVLGLVVTRIRATGGGAQSDAWLQDKADATGFPVERPAVRQAGAFAAAVLAGSAVGALPPVEEAVRRLVAIEATFEPRSGGPRA